MCLVLAKNCREPGVVGTERVMERVSGFEVRALIGHLDEESL